MFVIIRRFFEGLRFFIKWITGNGFFDMTRGGNIIFVTFILGGLIIKYVNYNIIRNIIAGVVACIFLIMLYIGYVMFQNIRLPRIIIHEAKTPYELLKTFTHVAYFYGLIIFSYMTSVIIYGILFYSSIIFIGHPVNLSNIFTNLIFITTSIFTVMWFIYHIIFNEKISIQQIKIRLNFYIAFFTTISTIIIWPLFQNALKPLITWLGISFVWLLYITEKAQDELRH
ncbi:hypothetical protein OSC52_13650 [Clostridium pasteurianum]|uniref:hypothetical protein n=1 Tax=Clostridium pasteurianum TaxID=1501 RepID=UPI002260D5ED|nr:hypothetical protein [Clostridium pasteurianum]UZW12894.1 hypothetical protein OSC52_13650 [Clostridium pasteurianum]